MDYNRFSNLVGCHFISDYLSSLSDDELGAEIRSSDFWDADLNRELVWRANNIEPGLFERYIEAESEDDAERIVEKSAKILNVEIY